MICIAGNNDIAVFALKTLANITGIDLCICANTTDHRFNGWQKSLIFYAEKLHIRKCALEELYDISDLLFVALQYDRLIDPNKFRSSSLYNIHFS